MKKIQTLIVSLVVCILLLTGCSVSTGSGSSDSAASAPSVSQEETSAPAERSSASAASAESADPEQAPAVEESWTGDDEDGVAAYLEAYDKLPSNYMTKKEARKHGWEGGALHLVVPGKCIGGDHFGNYEGRLPEDKDYTECDLNTLNSRSRGAERIIYSSEGDDIDIWYTGDHYENFELIYGDGK